MELYIPMKFEVLSYSMSKRYVLIRIEMLDGLTSTFWRQYSSPFSPKTLNIRNARPIGYLLHDPLVHLIKLDVMVSVIYA